MSKCSTHPLTVGKVACEGQIEKSHFQEVPLARKGNLPGTSIKRNPGEPVRAKEMR
jgi:hypothetical protein